MSISADSARTGSCAIATSRMTASPVTTCSACPTMKVHATRILQVDVDAFVLAHRPTWKRLEELVKRRRRLTGAEVDELVDLYQRVSTHLSMVRTASGDSVLVGRLSSLVARARSAVTSAHAPLSSEFVRFWTVSFPVVAYRCWRGWGAPALGFFFLVVILAPWGGGHSGVEAARRTT